MRIQFVDQGTDSSVPAIDEASISWLPPMAMPLGPNSGGPSDAVNPFKSPTNAPHSALRMVACSGGFYPMMHSTENNTLRKKGWAQPYMY